MSDRRVFRWATTGARALAGTLVAAGFVVAVATAVAVPWPTLTREPVEITAVPAPEASVLSCAGSVLALGRDPVDAGAISVAADQNLTAGVGEGSAPPVETQLDTSVAGSIASVFTAEPENRTRTDVAATGSSTVSDEDLSGFAASPCRPPLTESWLVGGATTTGAADIVVISNPGEVAATVELTVFGTSGPVVPPGGDLVVAAGSQQALSLAGLALGQDSPVIRVSATGAPVTAVLQTSLTRTLLPGGVDQVGAIESPDPDIVIPGVAVAAGDGPATDAATVLRVLSPSADTTAQVTVVPTGVAQPVSEPIEVPLTAGLPLDLDLGGLDPREYTVRVQAEAPVVGAVWQTTGFGEGADFAWYTPAPALAVPSLFATPTGPSPALTVANPTADEAQVTVDAVDGSSSTTVVVQPGQSARFSLRARTVYSIDAGGIGVRAGVSLTGDDALAGYPVWSGDTAAEPIVVYP
ncbi:large extracellular alpha-helical protein [Microbacterium sp. 4R-513]|uniref:DUF5719 family protein n=1 Tax=Microbacterium sp. 4R-513 TaxID=2567934 RepID=UPI0013E18E31|nr:DUF5719 family protein [Microbacterium sp. 4R-513]QIG38295.1 large extracellular alpha-helical protein [Microbacterium sp. 4R-513]